MVPEDIRMQMSAAAMRIASSVSYRNVGTVEFIYDINTRKFYFLEINTRLQVEHPVTESVTGLDLVECMIDIADDRCDSIFPEGKQSLVSTGASVEVRLYAENPLQNFQPCAGRVTNLSFPDSLRVDTWITKGTEITTSYDPMIAKLIAYGSDRQEAIDKLADGLQVTVIEGVQTNLDYLRQIVASEIFQSGEYTTKSLDTFQILSDSFEVVAPGPHTTVQAYPGRTGYWKVGIPPSGPMDDYSFRLANELLQNPEDAAGLECTQQGPELRFHCATAIAVAGGEA
jgi:urea carboxylase/allophanate hydrolase